MSTDPSRSSPARIILAEDDRTTARLIEIALQRTGFPHHLDVVQNGDQVITALEKTGADLLILDLHMPAMNGFEVLEHVRHAEPLRRIPVVMFSSSSLPADVNQAYDLHVNAYVIKPCNLPDMCRTMEAILRFWVGTAIVPAVWDFSSRSRPSHSSIPCKTEE
jgi:CheY-like chemotaxis protein